MNAEERPEAARWDRIAANDEWEVWQDTEDVTVLGTYRTWTLPASLVAAARAAAEEEELGRLREALFDLLTQTDPTVVDVAEFLALLTDEQFEALKGYVRPCTDQQEEG